MREAFDGLDVLAFVAELVLWAACGAAAFHLVGGGIPGWLAAVVMVLLVVLGWGLVMAPRSPRRLPVTGRRLVVLALGGAAALLLITQGATLWAVAAAVSTTAMVLVDGRRRSTLSATHG